jgi:hypothetical protein
MKVAVANVGIAIAANPTILAPRGVLEQPWPAASAWPHLGVIPEPFPKVCPRSLGFPARRCRPKTD